jgi:DNA modification methylase
MTVRIINADVMDGLAQLESESVHCVVTSPPYFGLRDYGMPGQIGLEPTPGHYVYKLVQVFSEIKRVLRTDGTAWLNLGDSYQTQGGRGEARMVELGKPSKNAKTVAEARGLAPGTKKHPGLKPKDLIGIPWRVAFALQADGWWLRQDIIWSKPNPMPESVTDRCTKAHEYLFLLTKAERYFYDAEAIQEPFAGPGDVRINTPKNLAMGLKPTREYRHLLDETGRNKRSVWEVTTQPFPEAHFATFPPALIEPCIKAGCPEHVCAKCGAPWMREVEREAKPYAVWGCDCLPSHHIRASEHAFKGIVLDPFGGSGTTGLVADRLKRNAILIELNPEYAAMAERRVKGDAPLFAEVSL